MSPIDRAIASAGRRIVMQDAVTALGWAALAGVFVSTFLMLAERLAAVRVAWWWYAVVGGLAFIAALAAARARRPGRAAIAGMIDQRLNLKDRLATALYAEKLPADPFARRVVEDARAAAGGLHVNEGFRVRLHRVWGYVPPAAAVLLLLALLVPKSDLFGINAARQQRRTEQAAAAEATEQVAQAVTAIQKIRATIPESKESESDADLQKQLAEMTSADLHDPEMRKNIAAKLSDVESMLGQTAAEKQKQFQSLQNAMSRLENKTPGPADRFADALRRGDFAAAQQELDQLAKSADSMSEADKQAMAQQLKNLAEQLQQAAKDAAAQQAQAQQQIQQTLQNAGLSPQQVQQLAQQNYNPQSVQQALQQQGASPQQSQQTQQQVQQLQQQAQNAGQSAGGMQGISSPLGRMAQSMNPKSGGAGGSSSQQQQQQQMQQAAKNADSQISQMARMQQQLQQVRQSQSQARQAMQSLSKGGGGSRQSNGNTPTQSNGSSGSQQNQSMMQQMSSRSGPGSGTGGSKAGTGSGGPVLGQERRINGYQTDAQGDLGQGDGRVIASWMENGPMSKGAPQVSFDQAITEARKDAEQAVNEDRVPMRYHETIREYFNQVPESADRVAPPPAPK